MALPFLPGYTFNDPTKQKYHRSQTLDYKNGYALPSNTYTTIGGTPHPVNRLSEAELDELSNFQPTLTYGQAKQAPPEDFIPAHVSFDKKVLRFRAYFQQTVHESPAEYYRVRPVDIFYYLEDDSISVVEPHVENSGMPQGKLIKRQRLPKDGQGNHWHWKDLNRDINVTFYGKTFHIVDCDAWTAEYLASEGIVLNCPGSQPGDPYNQARQDNNKPHVFKTSSDFDKLKQFIELDRKVLRFYCVWDDRESMFGEMRPYQLQYYLVDDTVEVREVHEPNDGRDPFPLLLKRQKLPKNRYGINSSFPSCVLEISDNEIKDWYTPKDFGIGKTIYVYNRRFLIYNCDDFTKSFYYHNFAVTDFTAVEVKSPAKEFPYRDLPPYNGLGSLEDSMQSCLSLIPQPPKKDFIKMLENDHKILRFAAILDSVHSEDQGRRFIISYRLADDMITIYEPPVRNAGIIGGKFLERTRVQKPGSDQNSPVFYGPQDMTVGSCILIFKHKFKIIDADDFVLSYLREHRSAFPGSDDVINSLETLKANKVLGASEPLQFRETAKYGPPTIARSPGDVQRLVGEIREQLMRDNYINHGSLRDAFLHYDKDRSGKINRTELKHLCRRCNLPIDDDLIDALLDTCDKDMDGKIDYFEFINYLNWQR